MGILDEDVKRRRVSASRERAYTMTFGCVIGGGGISRSHMYDDLRAELFFQSYSRDAPRRGGRKVENLPV